MASFTEVLKHSGNYMIANLATRALAFISIPVYTRLLTTEDYGVYSIFVGVVAIMNNLLSLCTDQSVGRYYYDSKDDQDFRRFVGTSTVTAISFFIFNSTILVILAPQIATLVGLEVSLIYLMIPLVLINITGLTFEQIYQPQKKSKQIATSALSRVYLGFAFSIGLILLFKSDKYYGQILGQILAGCAMLFYWFHKIRPYFVLAFDFKFVKYIFSYSVPQIPYVLSGVIIEQFGKIALGSTQNVSEAGFYALAVSVASVAAIVTGVTNQAWYPYYFEYMNSGNYEKHDKDVGRIFRITLVAAMCVSIFGEEIGSVLAKKDFTSALYLVPVLVLGYVFHQFSYAYMRNAMFVRKTIYLSIIVMSAGVCNIALNLLLINRLGEVGAAISFALSYLVMGIMSWGINKFILKVHGVAAVVMISPLLIYLLFMLAIYSLHYIDTYIIVLLCKLFLAALFIILIMYKDRMHVVNFVKNKIKRR